MSLSCLGNEKHLHVEGSTRGGNPDRFSTPKKRYRHTYFEAVDFVSGKAEREFQQSDLGLVSAVERHFCLILQMAIKI